MNWDAIGAVGEVGGAIAVVATLIYLAKQIQLSAAGARFAAQQSLAQNNFGYSALTLRDSDLLRVQHHLLGIGIENLRNPAGLDEDDLRRAIGLFYAAFSVL